MFDLVEDGVLALGINAAGRLIFKETYAGSLSEPPLRPASTPV